MRRHQQSECQEHNQLTQPRQTVKKVDCGSFVYKLRISYDKSADVNRKITVAVATMQNRDLVSRIGVMFPEQSQWQYLYGDYSELKKLLTIKYGEPTECVEEFQGYSIPKTDDMRMLSVQTDKCKYASVFTTSNGSIELSIAHGEYSSCFVKLLYIDKTNNDSVIQDALDDL